MGFWHGVIWRDVRNPPSAIDLEWWRNQLYQLWRFEVEQGSRIGSFLCNSERSLSKSSLLLCRKKNGNGSCFLLVNEWNNTDLFTFEVHTRGKGPRILFHGYARRNSGPLFQESTTVSVPAIRYTIHWRITSRVAYGDLNLIVSTRHFYSHSTFSYDPFSVRLPVSRGRCARLFMKD